MKRVRLFVPLASFILLGLLFWKGLSLDPNYLPSALIDQPVPSFSLPTVRNDKRLITPNEFKGKVSLLNVWASWCISCRAEHKFMVRLAEAGMPIYGINYRDDLLSAREWLQELHNPYVLSVVDADGRLGVDLGVYGAPETFVVDKRGVIRHKHVGPVDESIWFEELKPIVDALNRE